MTSKTEAKKRQTGKRQAQFSDTEYEEHPPPARQKQTDPAVLIGTTGIERRPAPVAAESFDLFAVENRLQAFITGTVQRGFWLLQRIATH